MKILDQAILEELLAGHPWGGQLYCLAKIDSTNDWAKKLADSGAPEGTVILADRQTSGRGQKERSFHSPGGVGLYISFILRPAALPSELMHFTPMTGVAVCNAVEAVCGLRPRLKWPNDLILGGKKLGGILTELSFDGQQVSYLIVGIGININHAPSDFPAELSSIATSLAMETGIQYSRHQLAAELIREMKRVSDGMFSEKAAYLACYQKDCLNIGADMLIHRGEHPPVPVHCFGIDENGALLVTHRDGAVEQLIAGEVSIQHKTI